MAIRLPHCPLCNGKLTRQQLGAMLSALRKTHGGGAPRSDLPRCPCGAMTLNRAKARAHKCTAPETSK